jgi:hypothetical protein
VEGTPNCCRKVPSDATEGVDTVLFVVVPWMKVSTATLPGVKPNPLTVIDPVLTTMWLEDRARLRGAWVGVGEGRAVGEGDVVGEGLGISAITWRVAEP